MTTEITFPIVDNNIEFTISTGTISFNVTPPAITFAIAGAVVITGEGGGSGPHDIFSDTHTDTTGAAAPVRGDLIVANSTPAWSKLSIGTTGKVLKSDGTDASWQTLTASDASAEPAGSCLKLDQTTPQSVIGTGRPTYTQGLKLGTTPTGVAHSEGSVYYDSTWKTISADIDTDVTLQVGQEEICRVYNPTVSQINNGQLVYISGAFNGYPSVGLAKADSDTTSYVFGMATQNIPASSYGFVTFRGNVNDLNTNLFTAGDILYLSETTAGSWTNVIPPAPNLEVRIGRVMTKDPSAGRINVRIYNNYRLGDLSDVTTTSPTLDQVLRYNGLEWVNGPPVTSSASIGISFFLDDTTIIGTGVNNANEVVTLSKVPITATSEVVDNISVTAATSPVLKEAYLYNTALGRTTLDGGVWTFNTYASVSSVGGGRVSSIIHSTYAVVAGAGTVTTTGTLTTRTCTVTGGTPFVAGDDGATRDVASYVQTPQGLYEIIGYTSSSVVTIATPSTYSNEVGVAYSKWKFLFKCQTPTITSISPNYALYVNSSAQSSFAINTTDKLGLIIFGVSNNTTTVTFTHNGTTHYSNFLTPLITLHNNLAGLQGGAANDYNHLTTAQVSALHAIVTKSDTSTVAITLTGQLISATVVTGGVDHGGLAGLANDTHTQYLKADGTRPLSADWDAGSDKTISVGAIAITGSTSNGSSIGLENNPADITVTIDDNISGLFFQRQLPISRIVGNDPASWSMNYSEQTSSKQEFDVLSGQYRPYIYTSGDAVAAFLSSLFRPTINAFMSCFDTAILTAYVSDNKLLYLNNPVTLTINNVTVYRSATTIALTGCSAIVSSGGTAYGVYAVLFDSAGTLTVVDVGTFPYSTSSAALTAMKNYVPPADRGLLGFLAVRARNSTTWTPTTSNINNTDALYVLFFSQVLPNNNRYLKGKLSTLIYGNSRTPYLSQLTLPSISAAAQASTINSSTHINFLTDSLPIDTKKHIVIIKALFPQALNASNVNARAVVGISDLYSYYGAVFVGLINGSGITNQNSKLTVMSFDSYDTGAPGVPYGGTLPITYFAPAVDIPWSASDERTIVILSQPTSNYWEVWIDGVFICSKDSVPTAVDSGSPTVMNGPDFSNWVVGTSGGSVRVSSESGTASVASEVKVLVNKIVALSECWA